jgi:hypothetical protein
MTDTDATDGAMGQGSAERGSTSPTAAAKEMMGAAGDTVRQEAAHFAATAKEKAGGAVERGKETATATLGQFANAIRKAGDELSQNDQSPAARVVKQAADGLESLSRSISDKRPEEMLDAVRDFGRRNPMAFVAGAVLAGLAVGRFIRSTERAAPQGYDEQRFTGGDFSRTDLTADTGADPWPTSEPATFVDASSGLDTPLGDELGGLRTGATDDIGSVGVPARDLAGSDDDQDDIGGTPGADRGRFGSGI